ncbi:hypothetical protein [Streptomyces sp. NBC_00631]
MQEYADTWGGWPIGDGSPLDRGAGKLLWFEVRAREPGGNAATPTMGMN